MMQFWLFCDYKLGDHSYVQGPESYDIAIMDFY